MTDEKPTKHGLNENEPSNSRTHQSQVDAIRLSIDAATVHQER